MIELRRNFRNQYFAAAEEIGDIVGEIRVLKWISGATIALVLVVIGLLFQIAVRLPS